MKRYFLIIFCSLLICLPAVAAERIIDTRTGDTVTHDQLVQVLSVRQFILLGERHDNPIHHQDRGELVVALKSLSPIVVAEHLDYGKKVAPSNTLLVSLEAAGFDSKSWHWPLHETLFQPIIESNIPLVGGNISREIARKAVREGERALPGNLVQLLQQAPLTKKAQSALDADLLHGHCGHLPADMLQGLRLAQRARDAAMFDTLRTMQSAETPAILLAGNGHVRLDYGVPSLIRHHLPDASYVSIGFVEEGQDLLDNQGIQRDLYDYLWIVPKISRIDPCETFKAPAKTS